MYNEVQTKQTVTNPHKEKLHVNTGFIKWSE